MIQGRLEARRHPAVGSRETQTMESEHRGCMGTVHGNGSWGGISGYCGHGMECKAWTECESSGAETVQCSLQSNWQLQYVRCCSIEVLQYVVAVSAPERPSSFSLCTDRPSLAPRI